jgi:hypothetical protein
LTLTLLPAALGGCSEGRELRTSGQAAGFVVEVAGGESPADWKLASKPTAKAAQAWADASVISDLGRRLRSEGSSWTCEFAHKSVGLGSIGYFDETDSPIVTKEAAALGVKSDLISAMLHDVVTLHYREFVLVTTSICGPYRS